MRRPPQTSPAAGGLTRTWPRGTGGSHFRVQPCSLALAGVRLMHDVAWLGTAGGWCSRGRRGGALSHARDRGRSGRPRHGARRRPGHQRPGRQRAGGAAGRIDPGDCRRGHAGRPAQAGARRPSAPHQHGRRGDHRPHRRRAHVDERHRLHRSRRSGLAGAPLRAPRGRDPPAARRRPRRRRAPERTDGIGAPGRGMGASVMVTAIIIVLVVLLAGALTLLASSVRVLREYERGVVFRLGRVMDQRGPGLLLLIPALDRMVRVSLRTVTLSIPPQEIITRDNVPVRVTAVAYYRVIDPRKAVTEVESYQSATLQISQTSLRSVLGVVDLDTLLSEREHLNESLQRVIDTQTEPWGIKVTTVEIKDVEIPERMQHAIARQAEAERERRAKIINAEGEAQGGTRLADAADIIGRNPTTLQLRYLQTLREIGATQNSTVVFPMPIDLIQPVLEAIGSGQASPPASQAPPAPANGALE